MSPLGIAWILACHHAAPPAPAAAQEPTRFACRAPPPTPPEVAPKPPAVPPGALEVRLLSEPLPGWTAPPPAPPAPTAAGVEGPLEGAYRREVLIASSGAVVDPATAFQVPAAQRAYARAIEETRVSVMASAAPLPDFAIAISRATGLRIVVDPRVADVQVSAALPDASLVEALAAIRGEGVGTRFASGVLTVEPPGGFTCGITCLAPAQTLVLPSLVGVDPVAFAAGFCEVVASARGRAVVIGESVVLVEPEAHRVAGADEAAPAPRRVSLTVVDVDRPASEGEDERGREERGVEVLHSGSLASDRMRAGGPSW